MLLIEAEMTTGKSKLDFTKDKLKPQIIELANLNGYQMPSTYLSELLNQYKQISSVTDMSVNDFLLDINYLCREYADKFWSEAHKKDISDWLKKNCIRMVTNAFDNTWDPIPLKKTIPENLKTKNEIAGKLIGLIGNHNQPNTKQVVYYYIDEILKEYSISSLEARKIVLKMSGSFSPDWNKNVIPQIIKHLEQISSHSSNEVNPIENLDKMIDSFKSFIADCDSNFSRDIKENDKILTDSDITFADEAYDLTTLAFQEIKKLMSTQNENAKELANYYYVRTNDFLIAIDRQIQQYKLEHPTNFLNTMTYFDTVLWLREFHKDMATFVEKNIKPDVSETNEGVKKHYANDDFSKIIDDLLRKEMFEVNDFLEYHFSQAFFSNRMSKYNWLTSFRKKLMSRYERPNNINVDNTIPIGAAINNPAQINIAFNWEFKKNIQLLSEKSNVFKDDFDGDENNHGAKTIKPDNEFLPIPKTRLSSKKLKKTEKLSHKQIALKYVYEDILITRGVKADEIARKFGHTSGETLYQDFTYFSSAANRKGKPTLCTPKKLSNKIKLLESVLTHLSESAKKQAKDEIKILKSIYESEYE